MSKITDYGIVLLTQFTHDPMLVWTSRDLSNKTKIPLPTVGKVLKILSRADILFSTRGAQGGYRLSKIPKDISLAQVIKALEGDLGITQCLSAEGVKHSCGIQKFCSNKTNWQKINIAIINALENLSLSDMSRPIQAPIQIGEIKQKQVSLSL
ncbi:MAG: SUF system Fe-S cluster assembly regulator [Oligoflexia bacterium]|nr:SUF system Fe-S cluster assembly regulator [Oligoflexia bacterium]